MINKKTIFENIVHELMNYASEIKAKAENNLLDDNVLSEDFIRDLLNTCCGWNLINLNEDTNGFPGIDLGDKERHIGVQVTSNKTSKKITDSLDKIVDHDVDKVYNEIYFFILGKKQDSYSVDFTKYETLDCSEKNIWDFEDIISRCVHFDSKQMEQVWDVIKQEIAVNNTKFAIPLEIKKGIIELKKTVHRVFETSNQLIQTHYASVDYVEDVIKTLGALDQMLPYLDENTYITCREVLEDGLELGQLLQTYRKWERKTQAKCICINYKALVEKNLKESSELISNDILGLQNGINIIIDGDSLYDRLIGLKIDEDILYKQFSVMKFQQVIEDIIFKKSKKCIIIFSKDGVHFNEEVICQLEAEGTEVKIVENRLQTIEFVCEQIKRTYELALISSSEDMMSKVSLQKGHCYLYTVSFENDLPTRYVPFFFSKGNITMTELNHCFNYKECKKTNIKNINEATYKDMLANADDSISHQLRVDWSGDVYISTITGAEEIDDVMLRWESWDSENGYVGPRAASDYQYVKQSVDSLKKCWEKGIRGYCDFYALL